MVIVVLLVDIILSADVSTLNSQGVEAYNNKDFVKSVALFTEVFKQSSGDRTAMTNLSTAIRSLAAEYAMKGDYDRAETTLRQAVQTLLPNHIDLKNDLVIIIVNKATICYNTHDFVQGRKLIAGALELDSNHPVVNRLAGDFAYAQQDLRAAADYWKRAYSADPGNTYLADRIRQLGKEMGVENSYSKMNAYSFDIRFDYQTCGNGAGDLRQFLMQAYEQVGQLFERFPEYPIAVILYNENDFRSVNNVPGFVAGLYDGKIRVPVNFMRYPLPVLKGIIFHEYAHALIHDLAGISCPLWLNEGIAMRLMNDHTALDTDVLRAALQAGATLSFEELNEQDRVWRNTTRFPLAYAQSWIIAEYLFDRWSAGQVKRMLQRMKQGDSFETILLGDMNRTMAQFDDEWKAYARNRILLAQR